MSPLLLSPFEKAGDLPGDFIRAGKQPGDEAKNVLWCTSGVSLFLKNAIKICETNNISTDSPTDIAECIVNIDSCLREISSSINVFISGLISYR